MKVLHQWVVPHTVGGDLNQDATPSGPGRWATQEEIRRTNVGSSGRPGSTFLKMGTHPETGKTSTYIEVTNGNLSPDQFLTASEREAPSSTTNFAEAAKAARAAKRAARAAARKGQ